MLARGTLIALLLLAAACERPACDYGVFSCELDEECHLYGRPPGRCLDDHETGRICAVYFDTCPTKLQWDYCGGTNGNRSSWAGRCVRPEFIPGYDAGALDISDGGR